MKPNSHFCFAADEEEYSHQQAIASHNPFQQLQFKQLRHLQSVRLKKKPKFIT